MASAPRRTARIAQAQPPAAAPLELGAELEAPAEAHGRQELAGSEGWLTPAPGQAGALAGRVARAAGDLDALTAGALAAPLERPSAWFRHYWRHSEHRSDWRPVPGRSPLERALFRCELCGRELEAPIRRCAAALEYEPLQA